VAAGALAPALNPLEEPKPASTPSRPRPALVREALAIDAKPAQEDCALGFMPRFLVQTTLPHSRPNSHSVLRRNGQLQVAVTAHPLVGLPFGRYPRLLLAWITTQAVRTKQRHLEVGSSLCSFMTELGLQPRGGQSGTLHRLRDQRQRLYSVTITCTHPSPDPGTALDARFRVAEGMPLWWNPKCPKLAALWETSVTLSSDFFQEITERPVPIDFRTLKALRSPLAMDIYCWLTYRMSYLKRPSKTIPWRALQSQFGCDYARTRTFKERFVDKVRQVLLLYPEARLTIRRSGIILRPSPTHVSPKSTQFLVSRVLGSPPVGCQ